MALASPLPGGTITQRFGPSSAAIQPSMYYYGTHKAWWQYIAGWSFSPNVHAGVDFAGFPAGSFLFAAEAGTVTRAEYDGINGGGWVVEVEIRAGVRYSYNHCQKLLVRVGQKVTRGAAIATIGATGTILLPNGTYVRSAYGVHCHTLLLIRDSAGRWILYDFADFMAGGSHAADARIRPVAVTYPLVTMRPGFNMRSTPDLDVGDRNIVYISRSDGVYNRAGQKVAKLGGWQLRNSLTNDDGIWGQLYGLDRYIYVISYGYNR